MLKYKGHTVSVIMLTAIRLKEFKFLRLQFGLQANCYLNAGETIGIQNIGLPMSETVIGDH